MGEFHSITIDEVFTQMNFTGTIHVVGQKIIDIKNQQFEFLHENDIEINKGDKIVVSLYGIDKGVWLCDRLYYAKEGKLF